MSFEDLVPDVQRLVAALLDDYDRLALALTSTAFYAQFFDKSIYSGRSIFLYSIWNGHRGLVRHFLCEVKILGLAAKIPPYFVETLGELALLLKASQWSRETILKPDVPFQDGNGKSIWFTELHFCALVDLLRLEEPPLSERSILAYQCFLQDIFKLFPISPYFYESVSKISSGVEIVVRLVELMATFISRVSPKAFDDSIAWTREIIPDDYYSDFDPQKILLKRLQVLHCDLFLDHLANASKRGESLEGPWFDITFSHFDVNNGKRRVRPSFENIYFDRSPFSYYLYP